MRLLIADDQELVRDSLAVFLRQDPDFAVDVAPDLYEALALVSGGARYDLVLLDYTMPGMDGLAGLDRIKAIRPGLPVAILSGTAPHSVAAQALAQGACGFLLKTMSVRTLLAAARLMAEGKVYAPAETLGPPPSALARTLTPRELDMLRRLCRGMANKEIARELALQEVTVKLHIKTLYRKIGARNRTHAAMIARELGVC